MEGENAGTPSPTVLTNEPARAAIEGAALRSLTVRKDVIFDPICRPAVYVAASSFFLSRHRFFAAVPRHVSEQYLVQSRFVVRSLPQRAHVKMRRF